MRKRLERGPVDYQVERSNEQWIDHQARTLVTGALIAWQKPQSILDPACGDGSIVLASMQHHNPHRVYLNDVSIPSISRLQDRGLPPNVELGTKDIMDAITSTPHVDMMVLTETLEHLEDPDQTLALARKHASILVASSPEMREGQEDPNPEHLWQFDGHGYLQMLAEAGWRPQHKTHLAFPGLMYDFAVWVCR